jgi:hypothetical protein
MGRPLRNTSAWPSSADTGLRRRRSDLAEPETQATPFAPAHDLFALHRLMAQLERQAALWDVAPGCEVQIDLRHALGVAFGPHTYRH